ncbi:MAG: hypothetical protein ACRYE9_03565 [Janthinobacterium lividum]
MDLLIEKFPEEVKKYVKSDEYKLAKASLEDQKSQFPNDSDLTNKHLKLLNELKDKLAKHDEAIAAKKQEIVGIIDEAASSADNRQGLEEFSQKVLHIIAKSTTLEIEKAVSEYIKKDSRGNSRLDKDLEKVKPYLTPRDRLLDLASNITKSLGLTKLSKAIEGNISEQGKESIRVMNGIKEAIKKNLTSLSNRDKPTTTIPSNDKVRREPEPGPI